MGINATTFTASQQLYLVREKDLVKEDDSSITPIILLVVALVVFALAIYRKDVMKLISKISKKE